MWRIPFRARNVCNSLLVNAVPLSDMMVSGIPCVAKMVHRCCIVAWDEVDGTTIASNHFECASTMIKNILPMNGPAWSMCRQDHGCSGALGGIFW